MSLTIISRIPGKLTWFVLYLVFGFGLSGCDQYGEDAPVLRVGTNVWPGYEPLYLARHLGYLDEQNIRLVEYSSTSQVIRSYRNGLIDAAAMTLDEALLLLDQGYHPKVVLIMDISDGADVIIGKPPIKDFQDLKNKRVGVEDSALGAFFLARALEKHGMYHSQIKVVSLDIDKQFRAFKDNRVDAVVTFDPVRSKLLELGGRQVFDSSQIPGEIVDVLVVKEDYLKEYPDQIEELKNSWFKSLKYFANYPEQAAQKISLRMKLSPEETLDSYVGLRLPDKSESAQLLGHGKTAELLSVSENLATIMLKNKLIRQKQDTSVLYPENN